MASRVLVLFVVLPIVFRAGQAKAVDDFETPTVPVLISQSEAPGLFTEVEAAPFLPTPVEAATVRSRLTTIPADQLPRIGGNASQILRFDLFPDADFVGVVQNVERRTSRRFTLSGRLADIERGSFILVREGDVVVADIDAHERGNYEVRPTGDGLQLIRQVNESAMPPCGVGPAQVPPGRRRLTSAPKTAERGAQATLDVMVVYTPAARDYAGGTAATEALVRLFVGTANGNHYPNSGIHARLRLVHIGEVAYDESNSGIIDLNRLTFSTDGYMDEIHALRDLYGADIVVLLAYSFQYCGIGWMYFGQHRGFSIANPFCAAPAFVHEIGHNMGCAHDRDNAVGPGRFGFSYGHRFVGQSDREWRDVMAYPPGQRIRHFSNPLVLFDGVPTGVPEGSPNSADNARTVNQTAPLMAEYRPTAEVVDCNGNTRPDAEDLHNGTSLDCNANSVPDECDVASGSEDVNENDIPDECECDASACDDGVLCTLNRCDPDTGACLFVTGVIPFGDINYNGRIELSDILCAVDGFADSSACPQGDIYPCGGDGYVDIGDVLAVLRAFQDLFDCPSPCP